MPKYVIRRDKNGKKEVTWQNTLLDELSLDEVNEAAEKEFPPGKKLYTISGIMSLTLKENPYRTVIVSVPNLIITNCDIKFYICDFTSDR